MSDQARLQVWQILKRKQLANCAIFFRVAIYLYLFSLLFREKDGCQQLIT